MNYNIKSSFAHLDNTDLSVEDLKIKDYIQEIIEESLHDNSLEKEDIIELLKEIFN